MTEDAGSRADAAVRNDLAAELSRRDLLARATGLGLGALVLSAVPVVERLALPEPALAQDEADLAAGTLQAFFDTVIPGRQVPELRTELGHPIHPRAIAGVDPEPGAVFTDALLLSQHPKVGFSALEPAFLAELSARSLEYGGQFLDLHYSGRELVCIDGLAFGNPARPVWEAAAAVAFTAFCGAANVPNANGRPRAGRNRAAGYRVMGHPGVAPRGYRASSYGRRLNRGRTRGGSLE